MASLSSELRSNRPARGELVATVHLENLLALPLCAPPLGPANSFGMLVRRLNHTFTTLSPLAITPPFGLEVTHSNKCRHMYLRFERLMTETLPVVRSQFVLLFNPAEPMEFPGRCIYILRRRHIRLDRARPKPTAIPTTALRWQFGQRARCAARRICHRRGFCSGSGLGKPTYYSRRVRKERASRFQGYF
jgi:hypothetical protein